MKQIREAQKAKKEMIKARRAEKSSGVLSPPVEPVSEPVPVIVEQPKEPVG